MTKRGRFGLAATLVLGVGLWGCAVRPLPDPRNPAPVRDGPVLLRVCAIEGGGAHLAVGDQVELATTGGGRLSIRHLPGSGNRAGPWNDGEAVKVKKAVLAELVDPRGQGSKNTRRFVPVGRFRVRVGDSEHAAFDFLATKATERTANSPYPECNVDAGADQVLIRGVDDGKRHGGHAILD
jgi:hypothetical protein